MALRFAYLRMHRETDAVFADSGVTADQFVLISILANQKTMTQQELADYITSDRNTLRAMLLLLEQKGLVRREPHPTDRRARLVRLTAEGEQIQQCLWARSDTFRQRLGDVLSPQETETLLTLLHRFVGALSPNPTVR